MTKHTLCEYFNDQLVKNEAVLMHIENISPEEIVKIEIATGEPIFYKVKNKEFIRI